MGETLPLSEVKAHLSELVDRVEGQHDRVTITRNGRPAAVLLSPDDLESLEETLEIMSDRALMEAIAEGGEAARTGHVHSLEEIKSDLAARRSRGG